MVSEECCVRTEPIWPPAFKASERSTTVVLVGDVVIVFPALLAVVILNRKVAKKAITMTNTVIFTVTRDCPVFCTFVIFAVCIASLLDNSLISLVL